jgi:hypothetical protein
MSNATGVKEQKAFETGKKLTLKQSVLAKCADCMGNYADGKIDCRVPECSLYPFMVYGVGWKGRVKKIIPGRTLEAMHQGLKRHRNGAISTPKAPL